MTTNETSCVSSARRWAITAASATPGRDRQADSTSRISTRYPRIFTWSSRRPRNSKPPSADNRREIARAEASLAGMGRIFRERTAPGRVASSRPTGTRCGRRVPRVRPARPVRPRRPRRRGACRSPARTAGSAAPSPGSRHPTATCPASVEENRCRKRTRRRKSPPPLLDVARRHRLARQHHQPNGWVATFAPRASRDTGGTARPAGAAA